MPETRNRDWAALARDQFLPSEEQTQQCPGGCYKHYVKGLGWVCCKCGH